MKAEELMLDDWVMIKTVVDDEPVPAQIKILPATLGYDSIELSPIPITSEILRKNGFDKKRLSGYRCHFKYVLYSESMNFELTALYDCDYSFKINNEAKKIEYVHELQHVLKICGIDKDFKL